jgi:hypothetical protein
MCTAFLILATLNKIPSFQNVAKKKKSFLGDCALA